MSLRHALAALLLFALSAAAENVKVILRVDTDPLPAPKGSKRVVVGEAVKKSSETVEVTLGRNFVAVTEPRGATVLDFEKRIRFDAPAGERATVTSLYATAGGREREMENRQFLAGMLEGAGAGNAFPLAASEHGLSMRADPPAKGIDRVAEGAMVRFRHKGQPLGEFSAAAHVASEAEREAFVRYVRHMHGGHPLMLAELARTGIPARTTIVDSIGAVATVITVSAIERLPDAPYIVPADATFQLASHEKWGPLLQRAAALDVEAVRTQARNAEFAAEAAVEEGRALDAFLLYMEAHLTRGENVAGLQRNAEAIVNHPAVLRVRTALVPKSEKEARKALATLAEVRKSVPAHAHVLNIFEANISTSLGDPAAAFESFHAALSARPHIAGAWHDVGMLFFNGYEADAAWNCWDVARRIAPDHMLLKAIAVREGALASKYPEFF